MGLLPDSPEELRRLYNSPRPTDGVSFLDQHPIMVAIEETLRARSLEQFRTELAHYLGEILGDDLQDELAKLIGGGMSESTIRAYKSEFTKFRDWCIGEKLPSLRTTPEVIAYYIVHQTGEGVRVKDLERAVSAIRWMHTVYDNAGHALSHGHTGDPEDVLVKAALKWARKCHENTKKTSREEEQPTKPEKGNGHDVSI
jgi:hypothetical protein